MSANPKWKPDSSKARPIPTQFKDYIWTKQKDLLASIFFGAVAGIAVTSAVLSLHAGLELTATIILEQVMYNLAATIVVLPVLRYAY